MHDIAGLGEKLVEVLLVHAEHCLAPALQEVCKRAEITRPVRVENNRDHLRIERQLQESIMQPRVSRRGGFQPCEHGILPTLAIQSFPPGRQEVGTILSVCEAHRATCAGVYMIA